MGDLQLHPMKELRVIVSGEGARVRYRLPARPRPVAVSSCAVVRPLASARCSSQDSIDSPGRGATDTGRAAVMARLGVVGATPRPCRPAGDPEGHFPVPRKGGRR